MLRQAKNKGDAAAFWNWFEAAAPGLAKSYTALVNGEAGPEPLIEPVAEEMAKFSPDIVHEIGMDEDGVFDFVVSADGLKKNIDAVIELVRAAPKVDGWKVTAFRPRKSCEAALLQMGGGVFGADDVIYKLGDEHDGVCDIEILFRGEFDAPDEAFVGPAFMLMDAVIGEFDVMTKIGEIKVRQIGPDDAAEGFDAIAGLAGEIDRRFPAAQH